MIKHVYIDKKPPKATVIFRDEADLIPGGTVFYFGEFDLTQDQIDFPEYSVNGIQVDQAAKREFEENDLDFQRQKKKKEILEKGNEIISLGVAYNGNIFQIDEVSLLRMSIFISTSTRWRDIDNQWHDFSQEELNELFESARFEAKRVFDKSREQIDTIYTLPIQEVKNFIINYNEE